MAWSSDWWTNGWNGPVDPEQDEFIKKCQLDDASITFLSGLPENVKDEVKRSICPAWEEGLSFKRFFQIVRDIWLRQLCVHRDRRVMKLVESAQEDDLRVVMMKFDPTRTKDGNVAARLVSFLSSVIRTSNRDGGEPFKALVPDCSIPERDVGRVLGERGTTMKNIVDSVCQALGHDWKKHGHRPILQLAYSGGATRFELLLYPPFNDQESFEKATDAVTKMVHEIMENPSHWAFSGCKRPPRLQYDDWTCPNRRCGNICFARRTQCNLCGAEKPTDWTPAHLKQEEGQLHIGDVEWGRQKRIRVMETKEVYKDIEVPEGHCRVVWLIPTETLPIVKGRGLHEIKQKSGVNTLLVTREVECDTYFGVEYVQAFCIGSPACTKSAISMIHNEASGRLSEEGWHELIDAIEEALPRVEDEFEQGFVALSLMELLNQQKIREAWGKTKLLRQGTGLRTLLEVLCRWPEYFKTQATGPSGATVCRTAQLRAGGGQAQRAAEAREAKVTVQDYDEDSDSWD